MAQQPGVIAGMEHLAQAAIDRAQRHAVRLEGIGKGKPAMAHLRDRKGDTVHLDVIDA